MLYVQTILKIADNSGGFFGLCIRVLTSSMRGRPGDAIVLSIKSILINRKVIHRRRRKIVKGEVKHAIVLRTSFPMFRIQQIQLRAQFNSVAVLGT